MAAGQHATGEKGGILRSFMSLLIMIAFVLGLSWALRTYVFTAYEIPSGSMEETIMTGDMVFAEKVSFCFDSECCFQNTCSCTADTKCIS